MNCCCERRLYSVWQIDNFVWLRVLLLLDSWIDHHSGITHTQRCQHQIHWGQAMGQREMIVHKMKQPISLRYHCIWNKYKLNKALVIHHASYHGIRYESDDVIWLRNHAYTWMLVPNIGCKQTMASNTGGPLTFFGVHTFFFFLITPRQYEEEKFRSNQTTLLKEILRLPIAE